MYVIKQSGKKEKFKPEKIHRTLLRAGASEETANEIVRKVKSQIHDGVTTRVILQLALNLLKKQDPITGARYDLKRAIMNPRVFPLNNFLQKF